MEIVFSVLALACSLLALMRNPPEVLSKKVETLESVVHHFNAEWQSMKIANGAVLEEMADLADTIETRRKRAAASASKAKRANEEPAEEMDPHTALLIRARQQGHMV